MIAFYSLYGTSAVRRVHLLRDGKRRQRPAWRTDLPPMKEGWCGTAGWDVSDGVGRKVFETVPEVLPKGLTWCPACVGRALEATGLIDQVARTLARTLAGGGDDSSSKSSGGEADGGAVRAINRSARRTVTRGS